jgi:hypothetical protein
VQGRIQLLVFLSATCSVCDAIIPYLPRYARSISSIARISIVLSDGEATDKFRRWSRGSPVVIRDSSLSALFDIPTLPYAVAIDCEERVLSKGVVNDVQQLESLLNEAERRGPDGSESDQEPQHLQGAR